MQFLLDAVEKRETFKDLIKAYLDFGAIKAFPTNEDFERLLQGDMNDVFEEFCE